MKKLRYLHCLLDDKFIDGAISLFEADSSIENDYVLFSNVEGNGKPQRIKNPAATVDLTTNFLKRVSDYDVVILHNLKSLPLDLIASIPESMKVVWLMWGFDFYNSQICDIKLHYPLTYKTRFWQNKIGELKNKTFFRCKERRQYERALNRIDYFSGVFPYEYDLLKQLKNYPLIKAKPLDFYYGSTNFFIPEVPCVELNNTYRNIIIGNSADLCNNTLDAFELIKDVLDVSEIDKMIVPLSYGGNPKYISSVKQSGYVKWGDKFEPLDSFLPLDEYLSLICNCKCAIFFHERQQASDNVFMQMLYGARVFMSNTSLMYKYLKGQGYKIFSLQKDVDLINEPLSYEDVMINRQLLSDNYSSSKLVERIIIMNQEIARGILIN